MTKQEFLLRRNNLYSNLQNNLYDRKYSDQKYFEDEVVRLVHNDDVLLTTIVHKASKGIEEGEFSPWGQVVCEIAYVYYHMGYIFDSECVQQVIGCSDEDFRNSINNALEEKSAKQIATLNEAVADPEVGFQDILGVIDYYAKENREDLASLHVFGKCRTEFILYEYLANDINHVF